MSTGTSTKTRLLVSGICAIALTGASVQVAEAATNYRSIAAISVRYSDTPPGKAVSLDDARRATFSDSSSPKQVFSRATGGQIEYIGIKNRAGGDVFGTWTLPMATPRGDACDDFTSAIQKQAHYVALWLAAIAHGVDLSGYNNLVVYTPSLPSCEISGFAQFNTQAAYVSKEEPLSAMAAVATHEVGHTWTLPHAGIMNCEGAQFVAGTKCSVDPYGDPFDMMGSSRTAASTLQPMQAFSLARLRALPASQIQTVPAGTEGTFRLTKTSQPADVGGSRLIMIPRARPAAYLPAASCQVGTLGSCTEPIGFQNLSIEVREQGVVFHMTAATTATNRTTLLRNDQGFRESWTGETMTDPATGVRIQVHDRDNTGATIVLSKPSAANLVSAAKAAAPSDRSR